MNRISLTDKRSRNTTEPQGEQVAMGRPGVIVIDANRSDVAGIEREGSRVVVRLRDGRRLVVEDFYRADSSGLIGDVVLRESDGSLFWWSNPTQDWGLARLEPLPSIDPLLLSEPANAGMVISAFAPGGGLLAVLGGVGVLGAAAAAGGGSSPAGGGTTVPPAGGGTTVPPAGGSSMSVTVPAASDGLSMAEVNSGVVVNITLPSTATSGDRITVLVDGRQAVTTTLTTTEVASGRIVVTLPSSSLTAVGEGTATIVVTVVDAAGAARAGSPASVSVSVDTTAPQLLNPNPNSYADNVGPVQSAASREPSTDDTTPGLNIGTIPAGTVPALFVNGLRVAATYDAATGTLTPNSPLPNGTHDLSYSLTDQAGNESVRSGSLRLTISTGSSFSGMAVDVPENSGGGISAAEASDGVVVVVTLPSTVADGTRSAAHAGPSAGVLGLPNGPAGLLSSPLAAAEGDRISVSIDGGTPVTVVLSSADVAAGKVNVTLPHSTVLAAGEGTAVVSAVYTTASGTSSSPVTKDVFIDTTAPVLTLARPTSYVDNVGAVQSNTSTAAQTDDATPGLNIGSLQPGTTPVLYLNGQAVAAVYAAATGSLTPSSPLPDGQARLAYSLKDDVGNESAVSEPLVVTISTGGPTGLAVSVPENAGGGINAAEASDGTPVVVTLPSAALAGERVSVSIDGGTPVNATLSAADVSAGQITVTLPSSALSAAGQGAATVSAVHTNAAGVASAPATQDVFIDTVAPGSYTVMVPENGGGGISAAEASDGVAVVVALPNNAAVGDVVAVNIDDGAVVRSTLTQADVSARQVTLTLPSASITAAGQGPGTVRTAYTDAVGNPSTASPVSTAVTIDTLAPTLTNSAPDSYQDNVGIFQSEMSKAPVTDDNTPGLVIGSLPTGATAAILYINGNAVASIYDSAKGTLRPSAALPDGDYVLSYSVRDAVGNESARSDELLLKVDTVPPQGTPPAITGYADNVGPIQSNESVAVATDDAQPGFRIGSLPTDASGAQLFVDGQRVEALYDPATGTLTPVKALLEGAAVKTFQIAYTFSDEAGNQSVVSSNFTVTVDAQAPTLNISQSTDPGLPTVTFRFSEAVSGFVAGDVTVNNGTLLNFTAVDDRTFTANIIPTGLAAPMVSVATGSYTDTVGNSGTGASLATTITDTTPPMLQSASTSTDGRSLVLIYNETLDAANTPALNAFTVLSGTPPLPNAVTAIAVSGNVVTLTLTNPIAAGATINLAYTDPTAANDARAIQDTAGNDAATQTSVSVVNQVVAAPITATISIEPTNLVAGQTATVTITFSALPTGFALNDLSAENGTLSALSTVPLVGAGGAVSYTATFTPGAGVNDSTNVITLAAGSYTDALGRSGGGATSPNYAINTTNATSPITPTILAISEDTLTGTGTTTSDFITNDRILTVSGSINRELAPGEKVQVQVDGGIWMDATVQSAEPTVWYLGLTSALSAGPHTLAARVVDATGQPVGTPTAQNATVVANVAPLVATSANGGLLGIISLDALGGALNLSQQQQLSATDVDNNLRRVVISTGGLANLVNLGTITVSQAIANELGLATVAATTGGLLGVGSTNSLTITAADAGELDNLRVQELLATVNLNGGAPVASVTAATAVTIAATDANDLTTTGTGNVTALSVSALSLVLPGAVIQGSAGDDTLTGDAAANRLYGFGGSDTLNGAGGDDLLRGGAGADLLLGGEGNDLLIYDAIDTSIDGGAGVDVLRVESGQLNLVTGTNIRNIETVNLGKGDGRSTAVISGAGLLANGAQTLLIEGDQEDAVTLQGATFNGQVLVGRQAFQEYLINVNGQVFNVRIEDGVPITVIGGGG